MDRIIHCRYSNCTAGDHQIVVGRYAMTVLCSHCETAAAIDRKVVVSKDRAVRSIAERSVGIDRAACQFILTALRKGQEHLIRLVHLNAGIVAAVDLHAVQKNPHF